MCWNYPQMSALDFTWDNKSAFSQEWLGAVLATWCEISSTWYLLVLCPMEFKSTWYLKAKYWFFFRYSKYFCQIKKIFRHKIDAYVFFNSSPRNNIMINYWNGSYCVCSQHGVSGHQDWTAFFDLQAQKYLHSLRLGDTICRQISGHHWFRQWLVTSLVPSHCLYLWYMVNWTFKTGSICPEMTHWGLVTPHGNKLLVTIGSGDSLSPVWCQIIARTNDILSIESRGFC